MAGEVAPDAVRALDALKPLLAELGIEYAVGGSLASGHYGEPRSTADVDLFVELPNEKLDRLLAALRGRFYAPEQPARDAVRVGGMFNIVHLETMHKIDIHVSRGTALDQDEIARRQFVSLTQDGEHMVFIASAEIIVLRKLEWYRRGHCVADHQWRDVLGVLKGQAGRLDLHYLRRMAVTLGLDELVERALAESHRAE